MTAWMRLLVCAIVLMAAAGTALAHGPDEGYGSGQGGLKVNVTGSSSILLDVETQWTAVATVTKKKADGSVDTAHDYSWKAEPSSSNLQVTVTPNGASCNITVKGSSAGNYHITIKAKAKAGSDNSEILGDRWKDIEVVPKITKVEITGEDIVTHGETQSYSVKAYSGDTDITSQCRFVWRRKSPQFKNGGLSICDPVTIGSGTSKTVTWKIFYDNKAVDATWREFSHRIGWLEVDAMLGTQAKPCALMMYIMPGNVTSKSAFAKHTGSLEPTYGNPVVGAEDWFAPTSVPTQSTVTLAYSQEITLSVSVTYTVALTISGGIKFKAAISVGVSLELSAAITGSYANSKTTTYSTSVTYTPSTTQWTKVWLEVRQKEEKNDYELIENHVHASDLSMLYKVGTAQETVKTFVSVKRNEYVDNGPTQ